MSTVIIIAPLVVTSWPLITAAITASVASLGYAVAKEGEHVSQECLASDNVVRDEITLENSEILAGAAGRDQRMTVEKDGIKATFHRDVRGTLRLAIEAKGYTKAQIRKIGDELIGRVTQQYAYNRLMTEMKEHGMSIIEETVEEDDTVKIRVRNW
ncbi:MAG: DUF1257 domain-containing protein [Thermoguttaceae bacterium]